MTKQNCVLYFSFGIEFTIVEDLLRPSKVFRFSLKETEPSNKIIVLIFIYLVLCVTTLNNI